MVRFTATGTQLGGHQTGVALSRHGAGQPKARARLASALVLSLLLAAAVTAARAQARQSAYGGDIGYLALPPSGEVLVENRRGGVKVEVWEDDHVDVSATVLGPKPAGRVNLPVGIERTENSLTIRVQPATARVQRTAAAARARGVAAAPPPRVDLTLRVPASARLKVYTSDGALDVKGLPASLVAQTISGDLTLALPPQADASVTAQSLNGTVTLGEGVEAAGARVLRGKLQARLGAGSRSVNLFSGRGHVSLTTLSAGAGATERAAERGTASRPRVKDAPEESPPAPARPPAPQPAETPQEVGEDEVVRVESDLVTLNVSVVDRASGRGLVGLTAGDFKVFEDGAEQRVEHFESAEAPFDLLLLLDLSGSTARVTDTIRAAARRFVAATRSQDRVAIVTFAGEQSVVSPPTSDRRALASAIDRIAPPKGDTRLYDSLAYALDYMTRSADPARRRAVILMSDGLDSTLPNVTGVGSSLPYAELRSRVQEFDGIVYTVWTSTEYEAFSPEDIQPETFDLAHDRLEELAQAGGGAFYEVEKLEDLAGAYERVVADLGTVYSLSYRPTNKLRDGRWRSIRVTLPRLPNAVARGRRGYFAK
jgi:VWFA-related protein